MNDWTMFESMFVMCLIFALPALWYVLKWIWKGMVFLFEFAVAVIDCIRWKKREKKRKELLRKRGIIR
jgi:hypothetical protein